MDDHKLFAEALRSALEDAGLSVAAIATTGEEGVREFEETLPDLVLMDVALPDQSGLVSGRQILEGWPSASVLAVSALDDRAIAEEALRIGFRGYLTKDTPVAQFVNSVRAVIDGQLVMPHRLGPAGRGAADDETAALLAAQLTVREREVLSLLVLGASGRDIARELNISRNTVRTHVQSILSKLQVHSRLEAAAFAVRHRLVDAPGFNVATRRSRVVTS